MISIDNLYEDEKFIKSGILLIKKKNASLYFWLYSILSIGIIPLICIKDKFYAKKWFYETVDSESEATHILIENNDSSFDISLLQTVIHPFKGTKTIKFVHKHLTYYQDQEYPSKPFRYFAFPLSQYNYQELAQLSEGVGEETSKKLIDVFNNSSISVPPISFPVFLFQELVNFFFLLQIIGIVLWFIEEFWMYSVGVIFASVFFTTMNYVLITLSHKKLKKLAECHTEAKVKRNGNWVMILADSLVPGDIVDLPVDGIIPCDCLLLKGELLVNESMLTGEAVPQVKSAYVKEGPIKVDKNSGSFLYCGTHILQKRTFEGQNSEALVIRTSFATEKGSLIREILFPEPLTFNFYKSGIKTLLLIGFVIAILYIPLMVNYADNDSDGVFLVFITFDTILFLLPPDLPIYITTAKIWSLLRLKSKGIFGFSTDKILIAGNVTTCFFDKTGTITESNLNLKGIILSSNLVLVHPSELPVSIKEENKLFKGMACCHSICLSNKNLFGDSMEIEMFNSSNWEYETMINQGVEVFENFTLKNSTLSPIKTYEFTSEIQMMSTVVKDRDSGFHLYSKGAPEKMIQKMHPDSIPKNYLKTVESLAIQGYRVLTMGYKELGFWDPQDDRTLHEEKIEFIGFLVFENKLKQDSASVIQNLNNANLHVRIISGDNPLTTISISSQSNIITKTSQLFLIDVVDENLTAAKISGLQLDGKKQQTRDKDTLLTNRILVYGKNSEEKKSSIDIINSFERDFQHSELAITGKAIEFFTSRNKDLPKFIIKQAKVYGRVKPDQKTYIIKLAKLVGEVVCMCGDGANDCGAIKAADIGVSFTDNEASLTAPFSSLKPSISAVESILMEGRCTMQISIDVFKIDILSNVLKFFSVFLLSFNGTFLGDSTWVWLTFINTVPMLIFIGASPPYHSLQKRIPDSNLFSANNFLSLFGQIIIYCIPLIIVYVQIINNYEVPMPNYNEGYDVTGILLTLSLVSILSVVSIYKSTPFKRYICYNLFLSIVILALFIVNSVILFYEDGDFSWLNIYHLEREERDGIYIVIWVFFGVAYLYEMGINKAYDKTEQNAIEPEV